VVTVACTGSDSSSSRSETASPSLVHCASTTTCPADVQRRASSVNHGAVSSSYRATAGRSCSGRLSGAHRGTEAKTTRIRTVLNEKQLHTLRTCYSANSRPDALMKEQLVEMTGLSPRVIRVWFQNKRCKDKKRSLALKQLHQRQQSKVVTVVKSCEHRPAFWPFTAPPQQALPFVHCTVRFYYRTQWTAEGSVFGAVCLCFLFVYEIYREPLNGFAPNSRGRRIWSLVRTTLKVKVKAQGLRSPGTKNGIFGPFGGLRAVYVW